MEWTSRPLFTSLTSLALHHDHDPPQLWDLRPARPSAVLNWDIASNVTSWPWRVQGWVVRFCPEDLAAQGELGSGPTPKSRFEHAAEGVAVVARRFGQNIVLHWYPHQWGKGALHDEHLHTNVLQEVSAGGGARGGGGGIGERGLGLARRRLSTTATLTVYAPPHQQIVPTRSGMQAVRSHGVVWRIGGPVPKPAVGRHHPNPPLQNLVTHRAARLHPQRTLFPPNRRRG